MSDTENPSLQFVMQELRNDGAAKARTRIARALLAEMKGRE